MLIRFRVPHFLVGIFAGILIVSVFIHTTYLKEILETLQALTITVATVFTAYWTSKTFAYQPKASEARKILSTISNLTDTTLYYVPEISIFKSVAEISGDQGWTESSKSIESKFLGEIDELFRLFEEALYIDANIRARALIYRPHTSEVTDLLNNREKRSEFIKKLQELRRMVINHAHFSLTDEWRRFRNKFKI